MKDSNEVIEEFNELINMTATELEKWLKSDDSRSAGWPKEDGGGESIGHDSGRKIVEILKSNPKKDPEKYTDDQVQHMRKVVSYCKRHLAQEEKIDNEKSVEELKKTKSYASLKNWGHDILKKRGKTDDGAEEEEDAGGEEAQDGEEEDEKQAGDKRKAAGGQAGAKKKRETQKGESNGADQEDEDAEEDEEELEEVDEEEGDDEGQMKKSNGKASNGQRKTRSQDAKNGNKQDEAEAEADGGEEEEEEEEDAGGDEGGSKKTKNGPKKGDTVSWNWGQGHPQGKVLDVRPEETTIETKRGNEVSRKGTEEDPAVVLDTGKSKAIKLDHELN